MAGDCSLLDTIKVLLQDYYHFLVCVVCKSIVCGCCCFTLRNCFSSIDGNLSHCLCHVTKCVYSNLFLGTNKKQTPFRAMVLNTIIGLIFLLPFPSWQQMVGFLVSCLVLGYVVGPMSLMVLSRQKPDLFHPFSKNAFTLFASPLLLFVIY